MRAFRLSQNLAALGLTLFAGLAPVASAATFTVTKAADTNDGACDGDCSLREALTAANAAPGADTIGFSGNFNIVLGSALPTISDPVTIDGTGRTVSVSGNGSVRPFRVSSTATLSSLTVTNGFASNESGGGVLVDAPGSLTVNSCTFANNAATFDSGAIRVTGTAVVNDSTFSGNTAGSTGGAIASLGTLTVRRSTFVGNHAVTAASAVFVSPATTGLVVNSTFTGNSTDRGGAIQAGGTVTLLNSTVTGCTATFPGIAGGVNASATGTLHVTNSIVAGNVPTDCHLDPGGTLATNAANLIRTGDCGGSPLTADPLLSPLGSWGGPTQTVALLPGSPAIGAGDAAACSGATVNGVDQRGVARPQGSGCDIGAFESGGFALAAGGGGSQTTIVGSAFAAPLTVTVSSSSGEPVDGGVVAFTPPASGATATLSPNPVTVSGGVASTTATANGVPGAYAVVAAAQGASGAPSFGLMNLPLPATHFSVAAPAGATEGIPFSFTVTALDVNGATVAGYAGTVRFTSSDGVAFLPPDGTLSGGVGTFSATLRTAGAQTLSATDTVSPSITGTASITVQAGGRSVPSLGGPGLAAFGALVAAAGALLARRLAAGG